jgi:ribosomal protein L40E
MARKSKGFIELEWTCPNCDTRNRGSEKTCVNCGAPQPDDVQFEAPVERKFVSEEKAGELRKRGADIHCGFCGTRNPSDATTCSQCGADLSEGVARQSGREIKAAAGPQTVVCNNCGMENPAATVNCAKCGAPLPRPAQSTQPVGATGSKAAAAPVPVSTQPARKKPNWLILGGIALGLLICCVAAIVLFAFPSQSLAATVSDVYWRTSVPVQEIHAVDYNDERGSPPSDAYNVSCQTDSREVCEEKTVDRGNGFAEVVEDCHTETDQYCDYTVDEWTTIQTYTLDGHDLYPVYEQPNLANDQRLGDESADFTVYFETDNGTIDYSPDSLSEFQQFQVGSSWTLKLNALGGVVDVSR